MAKLSGAHRLQVAMVPVVVGGTSTLVSLAASTDGGDPHTTGLLDWAAYGTKALFFAGAAALMVCLVTKEALRARVRRRHPGLDQER